MEEILTEKLITNTEAKEILTERKKEIELGYEQKNSLDYLKKYDKLTVKKSEKMMGELKNISKLRERQIIAIINTLPEDVDDLRLVMGKDYTSLSEDEKKLILETVKNNM
ncbi:MAG: DNA-directed RNA polymerase subunit F [Candidatus Aenigmarchaeota archaeon]|nr:DNA-directed RNA polymerase subunit F [Candidatus Aenigmarchaeota archaeon]